MKFLKVMVKHCRTPAEGPHQYGWPPIWNAYEIDNFRLGGLVYNGGIPRGEDFEEVMLALPDDVADRYLTAPEISELTEAEADAWLAANPVIQNEDSEAGDQATLLRIGVKLLAALVDEQVPGGLNRVLPGPDRDALDPDSSTRGIRRKTPATAQARLNNRSTRV